MASGGPPKGRPKVHDFIMFLIDLLPAIVRHSFVSLVPRTIAFGVIGLLLVGSLSQAHAASSVTLAWDPPNGASGIAGYRLHYGTSSGIYPQIINVGSTTTVTVPNLVPGQTYYVVVTDYNTVGLESGPSNQVSFIAELNTTTSPGSPSFPVLTNFISYSGDFNGDGKQDILWRNAQTGEVRIWYMDGARIGANDYVDTVSQDWKIVAVADFNGDGLSDILWVNTVDGSVAIWLMRGDAHVSYQFPSPGLEWSITGVSDIDHTGMAGILWRNLATGEVRVWRSIAPLNFLSEFVGFATVDWQLVGSADLDGDAHPELIWRNQNSGEVRAWKLSGATITANASLGIATPDWQIVGFGDLTGKGKQDILWQNATSGIVGAWIMNGLAITTQWFVAGVSPDWQIRATPDVDGNNINSIFWSNIATGEQVIWASNGSSLLPASPFATTDQSWIVQPGSF
jgi:hypothetical protein